MAVIKSFGLLIVMAIMNASMSSTCPDGCLCLVKSITCTNASLGHIPSNVPNDTSILIIKKDSIPTIKTHTFNLPQFTHLNVLILERDHIKVMEPKAFEGLTDLITLHITNNEIVTLESYVFQGLTYLKALILTDNEIENIDINAFTGLKEVIEIQLNNNKIKRIDPQVLRQCPQLEMLKLKNNKNLTITNTTFSYAQSLKILSLSHTGVSYVPISIFHNTPSLEKFIVAHSNLSSLDYRVFLQAQMLRFVNFDGNDLQCDCNLKKIWTLLTGRSVELIGTCLSSEESKRLNLNSLKNKKCSDMCEICNCTNPIVNCSHSNLDDTFLEMPPNTNVKIFDSSYNHISSLFANMFEYSGLSELTTLIVNYNNIGSIERGAFLGIEGVSKVYLSNNKLTRIAKTTFHGLHHLTVLSLSFNTIAHIEEEAFANLVNLKELYLQHNFLAKVTNVFTKLTKLSYLNLMHNYLTVIQPEMFQGLENLEELDVSSNYIANMYRNVSKDLRNLVRFDLSNNELSTLPQNSFEYMRKLNTLNLGSNNLQFVYTKDFFGLLNLKELNLQNNSIHRIQPRSFVTLTELKVLKLANNNLKYIEPNVFENLTKLKVLDLEKNEIKIGDYLFRHLYNLQTLILRHNKINYLNSTHFLNSSKISCLDLSENNISTLDVSLLRKLPSLKKLELLANPLHCDCKLQAVYYWCSINNVTTRAVCNEPTMFLAHKWNVLAILDCRDPSVQKTTANWQDSFQDVTTGISHWEKTTEFSPSISFHTDIVPESSTETLPTDESSSFDITSTISDVTTEFSTSISFHTDIVSLSSTETMDESSSVDITTTISEVTNLISTENLTNVSYTMLVTPLYTTEIEDPHVKPTTKSKLYSTTEFVPGFSVSQGYQSDNVSFSQFGGSEERISSVILYLLIVVCVLFCIFAGLLVKFIINSDRKTSSSNDISFSGEPVFDSGMPYKKGIDDITGIENLNFDPSRPATTGPVCLPMTTIDLGQSSDDENYMLNNNYTENSTISHQRQETAIVHREAE